MENTDFEQWATHVRPRLTQLCRSFFAASKLPDESEDIVQETLLRIWHTRDALSATPHADALAVRIAKNLCIDHYRRASSHQQDVTQTVLPNEETPESRFINHEKLYAVQRLMKHLTPTQQKMLTLRSDGIALDEIATICGTSKNCVKTQISSARKKLLTLLKSKPQC